MTDVHPDIAATLEAVESIADLIERSSSSGFAAQLILESESAFELLIIRYGLEVGTRYYLAGCDAVDYLDAVDELERWGAATNTPVDAGCDHCWDAFKASGGAR